MITLGTDLLKDTAFVKDSAFVTGLLEDDALLENIFATGLLEDDIFVTGLVDNIFLIWLVFFVIDGPGNLLLVFFWDSVSGSVFRAGGFGGILNDEVNYKKN